MITLEQLADNPRLFSRKKPVTDRKYSLEDLSARSKALAQKKLDAESGLKISDREAVRYADMATAIDETVSQLEQKFSNCPCVSTPASKEYDQSLKEFCSLNDEIIDIITDAKHVMKSMQYISKSFPRIDPKIHDHVKMSEFINALT